jgi:hypothetical protein
MKGIANFFKKLIGLVIGSRDKVEQMLNLVLAALPAAFPFVQLVVALTPTQWDDLALAGVRAAYPRFFDPTLTEDERKLYLLAVASELLRQRLPGLSVSVARICVQLAYALSKVGGWVAPKE